MTGPQVNRHGMMTGPQAGPSSAGAYYTPPVVTGSESMGEGDGVGGVAATSAPSSWTSSSQMSSGAVDTRRAARGAALLRARGLKSRDDGPRIQRFPASVAMGEDDRSQLLDDNNL